MITFIEGRLAEALPTQVTVNVGGVGYLALIPFSTFDKLPAIGSAVHLLTQLIVREDAHLLYGFYSSAERDLFRLLIAHVSGVGPKIALAVLSGMSIADFQNAVVRSDIDSISRIKGIGKKTAERIVLELKDKVGVAATWEASSGANASLDQRANDAILALISLGYKQAEAQKAVQAASKQIGVDAASEDLLRLALKLLA
ncbi:MAG: Holliday junction branch migration protein RuvA [Chthoniobacterales bacterium]